MLEIHGVSRRNEIRTNRLNITTHTIYLHRIFAFWRLFGALAGKIAHPGKEVSKI